MNVLNENTFSFFNNKSNLNYFGDWINNIDYYKQKFNTKHLLQNYYITGSQPHYEILVFVSNTGANY